MNTLEFDILAGEDISSSDEQLLVDFHLGNAINLDIVDNLVTGADPGYNLMCPDYHKRDLNKLRGLLPMHKTKEVGFLRMSTDIMSLPSQSTLFSPWMYKKIVGIVSNGLSSKGIQIPLTKNSAAIMTHQVTVKTTYERAFKKILKGISVLSDILRGGTAAIYTDVESLGSHVLVNLTDDIYPYHLYIGRNISAIYSVRECAAAFGNYDSVLLLMDTLGQRICLEVGCQITNLSSTPGSLPVNVVERIILLGDQILRITGNNGYEVIAMFEASVVSAILLTHPDDISDRTMFYNNCMTELKTICDEHLWDDRVYAAWQDMVEMLCESPPEILSNLFCIYRIWGHPRVDIKAGMQKVYDKGMMKKHSIHASALLVLCQFRRMFLNAYLGKNKSYPPMIIPERDVYVLNRLRKGLPVDRHAPGFLIWDYEEVNIGQIWGLPATYDVCHILNDKAVSPNRSEILESIKMGSGTVSGSNRRGIIRWMEGESIRCKDLLDKVNNAGLDEDSLIIGMYEKEREIKVKARMFSLMSEEMRMYFVLTEELIANHIIPYFPEITMKDPLHVQLRKIWAVGGKGQSPLNPNINIDFEKWNLNMRDEFTHMVFRQMDIMFGYTNLIARTHDIFKGSYVYSSSGKYVPPIRGDCLMTDPPMAYIGHLGGFEGLRQKGWTVVTVCLLAYIAESMNIEMCLLGQGDNQVLKLYMPITRWNGLCYSHDAKVQEAKEITAKYISLMHLHFADAGLPIKIRETWVSSRLFMYGKSMYLDGRQLPQWSKKLLRSYALSNEGSITLSGIVGTIATNMSAAAGASTHPDIMYVLFLMMAEWSVDYILSYHPFTRRCTRPGDRISFRIPGFQGGKRMLSPRVNYQQLMVTLLTIPTAVGGGVTIPLTSFIMRGFPDHAAEGYAWVKMLSSVRSEFEVLFSNWYTFMMNPTVQADMLIQSPWSLNHLKPPTPGLQSRDLVRDWMLSGRFSNNIFLRNMRSLNRYFDRKSVCQELLSDPMNPLISYEVYQGFPHSYYDSILRRFEGTRSVKKLAMKDNVGRPIVKKLMELEGAYLGYLVWRGEQTGEMFSLCATQHTRIARCKGWGRDIIGLTTPHPLEFLFDKVCEGTDLGCSGGDYIYLRHDHHGASPPYLGSKVKTKVVSQQDEGARAEPLICTNARIARYINWLGVGENLKSIVITATHAVCDIEIFDRFFDEDPYGEMYSGSIEHRFNPAAASEGCFINYSPQIGASVMLSSDHMPKYGKGKANYTLHFQAMYCFLQYIGSHLESCCSKHYHIECSDCVVPISDMIGDIPQEHPAIDRAFCPDVLPIIQETIGTIKERPVTFLRGVSAPIPGHFIQLTDTRSVRSRIYYGVLMLLSVKCAHAIFTRGYKQSEGLGSDDLQSFPRVYAYKIYTDHILWTTARILVYLQAIYSRESISGGGLIYAKRTVIRSLMNSTLSKFKDIASLCLGRNISKESWVEIENLSHGCYPETTDSFLRVIKHALIAEIESVLSSDKAFPDTIIIPALNCGAKEHQVLVGYYASISGCGDCMGLPTKENTERYEDCREKHINKILNKIRLANTTLDRAVKYMSIKSSSVTPSKWSHCGSGVTEDITTSRRPLQAETIVSDIYNQVLREHRAISLPTASIYKWCYVLSALTTYPTCIIVLGDGTGCTSYLAAHMFPSATIFPCAFIEGKRGIPQDLESLRPGLSRSLSNVSGWLLEAIPDDVTSNDWGQQFERALSKMQGPILIVSDIESTGGSWDVVQHVYRHAPIGTKTLVKLYGSELPKYAVERFPGSRCRVHMSVDANTQYGEYMLELDVTGNWEFLEFEGPINAAHNRLQQLSADHEALYRSQIMIETQGAQLSRVSLRLSHEMLVSKGLSITKLTLKEGLLETLGTVLNYINSRYRFPQDRIRHHDPRNLTDGRLDRLVSGLKVIILASFREDLINNPWFDGLYLSRCTRENRIHSYRHMKIVIVHDRLGRVPLGQKEISAARSLRSHYNLGAESPSTALEFNQKFLIPALGRDVSRHMNLLQIVSESVETLSDLSQVTLEE